MLWMLLCSLFRFLVTCLPELLPVAIFAWLGVVAFFKCNFNDYYYCYYYFKILLYLWLNLTFTM